MWGCCQSDGLHQLSCSFSALVFLRHAVINKIIKRSLDTAGFHSILEQVGLDRGDDGRHDGVTSFPFNGGKTLAWDATCIDSFSTSNPYSTILNSVSTSIAAENLKIIIIMVIFKCFFSGEHIALSLKKQQRCEHGIRQNVQIKITVHDAN